MSSDAAAAPRLVASELSKGFAGVQALRAVQMQAYGGEVLALLGENGAGKSTLLKILAGAHRPDSGTLSVDGETVSFASPRDAHRAGIRVIYQEPEIIPHVSVAENIYVGALPARGHRFTRSALRARVAADLERYGFTSALDPDAPGSELSPAQRQLVEILRALTGPVSDGADGARLRHNPAPAALPGADVGGARLRHNPAPAALPGADVGGARLRHNPAPAALPAVIAFDEPTSSLSDTEVEVLFRLIRRLRDEGIAIIYVSHRMNEIFQISDRVTVLRDGALVATVKTAETDEAQLVRMMVGRDLTDMFVRERRPRPPGPPALTVRGLSNDDVRDINLEVYGGEVLGIAGLVGAGRSELAHAIVGSTPVHAGEILVDDRPVRVSGPRDAIRAGIGFAPEERKAQALLMQRSVRDNISLAILDRIRRVRVVRRGEERAVAQRYTEQLRIRTPDIEQVVSSLSGGNQQKVVLARWLARRPRVLILDEPTRGVDVGAKAEIYGVINQLTAEGIAVIVISSELPEILGLSDRIVVMQGGRVTGELDGSEATEERVLALAMAGDLTTDGATR